MDDQLWLETSRIDPNYTMIKKNSHGYARP